MQYELPEITLPDWVIRDGVASINRMLDISKRAGL
jgi:quinolinate synthase